MKVVLQNYSEEEFRVNQYIEHQMILQRVSSGDKSAVEDCINAYGNIIWTLASKYTETTTDAENAVLEIFGDIWRYAPNFKAIECAEINFVWLIARRRLNMDRK